MKIGELPSHYQSLFFNLQLFISLVLSLYLIFNDKSIGTPVRRPIPQIKTGFLEAGFLLK
ncbi:MAG: hypothetical protein A2538_00640 [Candidatus Magasanikbacteria bacterium RIFOXYD2_FULL_41_14]|uniref:Uncharacterized protein n=1 Tax=Candidatus Magasanikbacteria bacterium RIFOXYD2_FULL_41_14 TaxID=1798709 RepID=A0A1F6PCB2_9BACT|nr:MAG: hypothetical protein A2538_00640 [Candidatus Magasanikbacteria bacterium RIFOXYD2_FULL_41_14]